MDRVEELQSAGEILEEILPYNTDSTIDFVYKTALSSIQFELEFCFDMDFRSTPLELPEDW